LMTQYDGMFQFSKGALVSVDWRAFATRKSG
jgi:hypothetical protein